MPLDQSFGTKKLVNKRKIKNSSIIKHKLFLFVEYVMSCIIAKYLVNNSYYNFALDFRTAY